MRPLSYVPEQFINPTDLNLDNQLINGPQGAFFEQSNVIYQTIQCFENKRSSFPDRELKTIDLELLFNFFGNYAFWNLNHLPNVVQKMKEIYDTIDPKIKESTKFNNYALNLTKCFKFSEGPKIYSKFINLFTSLNEECLEVLKTDDSEEFLNLFNKDQNLFNTSNANYGIDIGTFSVLFNSINIVQKCIELKILTDKAKILLYCSSNKDMHDLAVQNDISYTKEQILNQKNFFIPYHFGDIYNYRKLPDSIMIDDHIEMAIRNYDIISFQIIGSYYYFNEPNILFCSLKNHNKFWTEYYSHPNNIKKLIDKKEYNQIKREILSKDAEDPIMQNILQLDSKKFFSPNYVNEQIIYPFIIDNCQVFLGSEECNGSTLKIRENECFSLTNYQEFCEKLPAGLKPYFRKSNELYQVHIKYDIENCDKTIQPKMLFSVYSSDYKQFKIIMNETPTWIKTTENNSISICQLKYCTEDLWTNVFLKKLKKIYKWGNISDEVFSQFIKFKPTSQKSDIKSLFDKLPGIKYFHPFSPNDKKKYMKYNKETIEWLIWIPPTTPDFIKKSSYIEIDASFFFEPYIIMVPLAIIYNIGFPLGLMITPHENKEAYSEFFQVIINDTDITREELQKHPILADQGSAIKSFCESFGLKKLHCLRHFMENFGANGVLAAIVCDILTAQTKDLFDGAYNLYAPVINYWHQTSQITPKEFKKWSKIQNEKQSLALYLRNPRISSSNHIESLHKQLQQKIHQRCAISFLEKLTCITEYLIERINKSNYPDKQNATVYYNKMKKDAKRIVTFERLNLNDDNTIDSVITRLDNFSKNIPSTLPKYGINIPNQYELAIRQLKNIRWPELANIPRISSYKIEFLSNSDAEIPKIGNKSMRSKAAIPKKVDKFLTQSVEQEFTPEGLLNENMKLYFTSKLLGLGSLEKASLFLEFYINKEAGDIYDAQKFINFLFEKSKDKKFVKLVNDFKKFY